MNNFAQLKLLIIPFLQAIAYCFSLLDFVLQIDIDKSDNVDLAKQQGNTVETTNSTENNIATNEATSF